MTQKNNITYRNLADATINTDSNNYKTGYNAGVAAGKANAVTYLGTTTGGTFNAKSISGYQNLTKDNFLLVIESIPATTVNTSSSYAGYNAQGGIKDSFTMTKSYNASTGILSYSSSITCWANYINGDGGNNPNTGNAKITFGVYLK